MTTWGYLERIGGTEDATNVPPKVTLQDSECFVGRFAEPVKAPDSKFTHKTQTLVPCLFVSSTHFSVGKVDDKPNTYFVKDYSRNGTFLNGDLVGPLKTVEFKDNAEISLLYKNKVRILYRFKEVAEPVTAPSPKPASAMKEDRDDLEESSRFASMRSQADSVEFALNKQIGLLQEESRQHETRIAQQATRIETLTNNLNRTTEKNTSLEQQVSALESDKTDLTERLSTNEAHSAAVEARNQKLQEQVEETRSELRDLRAKNLQLTEDLQTKIAQLESRNALMESSNKTMTHEKNKWTKLENKYTAACEQLQTTQEELDRVKLASQTLQDILADRDAALHSARQRYEKLRTVLEAGRGAVQAREESIHALQQQLADAAQVLVKLTAQGSSLAKQNSYFDELAASIEGDQEWSSQLSVRDENTYAEDFGGSQVAVARRSPPRGSTSAHPSVGTPQGAQPPRTATGTVNGADSPSPSHTHRATVPEAQRLDIESEGVFEASQPSQGLQGGAARTADSQLQTQALQAHTQVPGNGNGRAAEKRKRSQDGEAAAESSPKKATGERDRAVVLTKYTSAASEGAVNGDEEGGGMDVQVEARDESDSSSGDEKDEEGDGAEDMQATQAPANFSHLFEDSDQEDEDVREEGEGGEGRGREGGGEGGGEVEGREGVEEALLEHEESVHVMEVEGDNEVSVGVEVEVSGGGVVVEIEDENQGEGVKEGVKEVEIIELCSPPRTTTSNTTYTTSVTSFLSTAAVPAPKATSVTCTDSDSEGDVSFDPTAALLGRPAVPSSSQDNGVSGGAGSGVSGEVAMSEQGQRESVLQDGDGEGEGVVSGKGE